MGLLGKKQEPLPVHKPEEVEHRDVLPAGKPKGVAEHNGKTFKEAGITESDYKEDEYDVDEQFEHASKIRNRELYGSVSSGSSSDQSSGTTQDREHNGTNLLDKMKGEMKKPLLS